MSVSILRRRGWLLIPPLALLCLLQPGCGGPDADSVTDHYELPEVEPKVADRVDVEAAGRFEAAQAQSSTGSDAADWPQLFGPRRTRVAPDQPVNLTWGTSGPPQKWSIEIGSGYGSPVVWQGYVVFNHRIDDEEIIQCVQADNGATVWQHRYPTTFECDVEYSSGPYSTPLIEDGKVYAVGGQGQLFCLELASGEMVWQRNLHDEFELEDGLFPVGSTPALSDGRLVFNLGAAEKDAGIIALDAATG
ncbi:MAG: PQQ-like beta-propeller repeat protein, partial [Pirellulales bacterium]|nr:PQQ-like beta-propeller repeat protein [Pirellulales bacterium]